jgi:hypothetical protein
MEQALDGFALLGFVGICSAQVLMYLGTATTCMLENRVDVGLAFPNLFAVNY